MNVYCELFLDRIRIKVNGDELSFQLGPKFYQSNMNKESLVSNRIKGYMLSHKNELSFFEKVQYPFTGNSVYMLVNQDVQEKVTIKQIHDYASFYLDGRAIYIIPRPVTFDSAVLEDVVKIRTEYIKGRSHGDTAMAQVLTAMGAKSTEIAGRAR